MGRTLHSIRFQNTEAHLPRASLRQVRSAAKLLKRVARADLGPRPPGGKRAKANPSVQGEAVLPFVMTWECSLGRRRGKPGFSCACARVRLAVMIMVEVST